jgi:uncharacterized protein YjiS (DUF1127 family)
MIADLALHTEAPPRATTANRLRSFLVHLLKAYDRARQRRALARFDDWLLRDIGISRVDAARECAKPFWTP